MLDRRNFIKLFAGLGIFTVSGGVDSTAKELTPSSESKSEALLSSINWPISFGDAGAAPNVKIIGIGGGGCEMVDTMIESEMQGAYFTIIDTDAQSLNYSKCKSRLLIGNQLTNGQGAGDDTKLGKKAARGSQDDIEIALSGADIVLIVAGMGGGTGSGASPVIAEIARRNGSLCVAVVTAPSVLEVETRRQAALDSIKELSGHVDSYIPLPIDIILGQSKIDYKVLTMHDSLGQVNDIACRTIATISDAIVAHGYVNLDVVDIRLLLCGAGKAYAGTGVGVGPNKAVSAAKNAIADLERFGWSRGQGKKVMITVSGGTELVISEFDEAVSVVSRHMSMDASILTALIPKEKLQGLCIVSIIAA
jgi:cell division protein FtsZ